MGSGRRHGQGACSAFAPTGTSCTGTLRAEGSRGRGSKTNIAICYNLPAPATVVSNAARLHILCEKAKCSVDRPTGVDKASGKMPPARYATTVIFCEVNEKAELRSGGAASNPNTYEPEESRFKQVGTFAAALRQNRPSSVCIERSV